MHSQFAISDVQDDLGTLDFTMKKYSCKKDSKSSPHKRVFTIDKEKLVSQVPKAELWCD